MAAVPNQMILPGFANPNTPERDARRARALRDAGIAQVTGKNPRWLEDAIALAGGVLRKLEEPFIGEDIRLALLEAGLSYPHHHNAWGALTQRLKKLGMIVDVPGWRSMKTPNSHSRKSPLYRRA